MPEKQTENTSSRGKKLKVKDIIKELYNSENPEEGTLFVAEYSKDATGELDALLVTMQNQKSKIFKYKLDVFNYYTRDEMVGKPVSPFLENRDYANDITVQLYKKVDTFATETSLKSSSNLSNLIMPLGIESASVEIPYYRKKYQDPESAMAQATKKVEAILTDALRTALNVNNVNFYETYQQLLRDYLDFGTCCAITDGLKMEHIRFEDLYYSNNSWEFGDYVMHTKTHKFTPGDDLDDTIVSAYLPAMLILASKSVKALKECVNVWLNGNLNFGEQDYIRVKYSQQHKKFIEFELYKAKPGVPKPFFLAKHGGDQLTGYGYGSGLRALGHIVELNFFTSASYFAAEHAVNPSTVIEHGTSIYHVTAREGQKNYEAALNSIIEFCPTPGSVHVRSDTHSIEMGQNNGKPVLAPLVVPIQFLPQFREVVAAAKTDIAGIYNTMAPANETTPANMSATAINAKVNESIQQFKSASAAFIQATLLPILTSLLYAMLNTIRPEEHDSETKDVQQLLASYVNQPEQVSSKPDGLEENYTRMPVVKLFTYAEQQLKILEREEIAVKLQMRGALAQLQLNPSSKEHRQMSQEIEEAAKTF